MCNDYFMQGTFTCDWLDLYSLYNDDRPPHSIKAVCLQVLADRTMEAAKHMCNCLTQEAG